MLQLNDFQTTRPSMLWLEFDVFSFFQTFGGKFNANGNKIPENAS